MSRFTSKIVLTLLIFTVVPEELSAQTLMETHGWITFEAYTHGQDKKAALQRSHRSEFLGIVDLYRWRQLTLTLLIGTTTDISNQQDETKYLDRIIYTYTYGGRIDLKKLVIRADYHHDCIHLLNRPEINGSTWWNAFQVRVGSKGSFFLYVPSDYQKEQNGLIGNLDARVGFSAFRKAGSSLQTGQNHNYKYEWSNLTRLHLAKLDRWIMFADQTNKLWITWDGEREYKGEITLNAMYRGKEQYLGLFYEYHFPDSYEKDREGRLGSVGLRILF
ncbi:MAG: hypothetical protein K9N38_01200 [Candidatus Marinimicrobia bacterium]|nr:hypothetical protein [Candidatus Neomarinimicrobiota bacterium]MCF7850042.1 hypothetical protein [Candidatus Neomarinimicrobiota bacterium]